MVAFMVAGLRWDWEGVRAWEQRELLYEGGVLPEESSKSPHPPDPCWPYFIICSGIRPSAWESVEGTLPAHSSRQIFPYPGFACFHFHPRLTIFHFSNIVS